MQHESVIFVSLLYVRLVILDTTPVIRDDNAWHMTSTQRLLGSVVLCITHSTGDPAFAGPQLVQVNNSKGHSTANPATSIALFFALDSEHHIS